MILQFYARPRTRHPQYASNERALPSLVNVIMGNRGPVALFRYEYSGVQKSKAFSGNYRINVLI